VGRIARRVHQAGVYSEFQESRLYIEQNPVVVELVDRPEDYVLSSASGLYRLDLSGFEGDRG
jgi:hypothetical protein